MRVALAYQLCPHSRHLPNNTIRTNICTPSDLITMASSEAEAGRAPPIPGTPLAPSHSTAPAPTAPLGAAGAAAAIPCVDVRSARQTPSRTRLSLGAPERVRVSTRNEGVLHHIPKVRSCGMLPNTSLSSSDVRQLAMSDSRASAYITSSPSLPPPRPAPTSTTVCQEEE